MSRKPPLRAMVQCEPKRRLRIRRLTSAVIDCSYQPEWAQAARSSRTSSGWPPWRAAGPSVERSKRADDRAFVPWSVDWTPRTGPFSSSGGPRGTRTHNLRKRLGRSLRPQAPANLSVRLLAVLGGYWYRFSGHVARHVSPRAAMGACDHFVCPGRWAEGASARRRSKRVRQSTGVNGGCSSSHSDVQALEAAGSPADAQANDLERSPVAIAPPTGAGYRNVCVT
jgi:hypothetical protein